MTYDSGDFAGADQAGARIRRRKGFAARKRESRKRGKLRGLGIGNFLEVTAPPSKELGDIGFKADGTVTLSPARSIRPGPRDAVRASAEPAARHSVRENLAAAGRQRSADRRRRLRRLEIDHA